MTAPLDGVRVLEVAIYAFVPSAAAILADWGADVLKVEHPVIGRPGPQHRRLGRARRGQRRLAPVGGGQPRQAGDDARHRHARGQGDPPAAGRRVRRVRHELPAAGPPQARHRARGHPGPQPADHLRPGQRPGPPRRRWPSGAASTPSRTGAAPAPPSASRRPSTTFPLAMPGPGFGDLQSGVAWPAASAPRCTSGSGPARASVVDVSLMSMGLWAMGMTISGTSVLDADTLPHQYHAELDQPAGQPVPHEGRPLHLPRLPPVRPLLARVLRPRRQARLARRRAVHRLGRPRGEPRGAASRCSTSCSPSKTLDEWQELLATAGRPVGRAAARRPGPARRAGPGERLRPARRARRRRRGRARRRLRPSSTARCP